MGNRQLVSIVRKNYREFCGIEETTVKVYNWAETLSADQFIKLLRTYSSHRDMPEDLRQTLYVDIRSVIHGFGGSVEKTLSGGPIPCKGKKYQQAVFSSQ